jgi:hypothetical protein
MVPIPPRLTLQEHARQLAKAFDVRLIESDQLKPDEAMAVPFKRIVLAAPVMEETTYAVVLHEIGHLAAAAGVLIGEARTLTIRRIEEDAAWNWARHYALEWTPLMESIARMCEATYEQAVEPPARPVPAMPPAAPPFKPIDWEEWK